jgi:hypothetical protein
VTTAKRRGAEAEIWPVEWMQQRMITHAPADVSYIRQTTGKSMPDLKVITMSNRLYVVQCKARRNLSIPRVLREAQEQAENYAIALGLHEVPRSALLFRPYGMGKESVGQWPLVQTWEQFMTS